MKKTTALKSVISMRIDTEILEKFKRYAKKKGVSMNSIIVDHVTATTKTMRLRKTKKD